MTRRAGLLPRAAALGLSAIALVAGVHAHEPQGEAPIFADDFERPDFAPWVSGYEPVQFAIADGVLAGQQLNPKHSATLRMDNLAINDATIFVDVMFAGGKSFNINLNHTGAKDVAHFGHIARVNVSRDAVRLQDDREGGSNLALRKLPKEERQEALKAFRKNARLAQPLEEGKWYRVAYAIKGDLATLAIDGNVVAELRSPGHAHPMKDQLALNVIGEPGGFIHFDNLAVSPL